MAKQEEFNALVTLNKIKIENEGNISNTTKAYTGSIKVNPGEGIEESMITDRKNPDASKELINTETITYKNVRIGKITSTFYSLSWGKYIAAEFSIEKGNSYIQLINFFMDGVDKAKLTKLYEVESRTLYVPSLLGMNLLYFFINKLKLEKKNVSDFHISMRKVKAKTRPYRNADNNFYLEFGFEKIKGIKRKTKRKSKRKSKKSKTKNKKKKNVLIKKII